MLSFKSFLVLEGGAGGHMAHPFDISSNGKELIDVFKEAIDFVKSGKTSVKIDGINASLRLVDGKFVLDRGSAKPLDIKGIRPEDLEARFGEGHGFVDKGKKIIEIFDAAYPKIKPELKKLGLLDNPNILFNTEYVEGQTNVVQYEGIDNFLAIHGLKEIKVNKTNPKTGAITSRVASNISFDQAAMSSLIKKLNTVAKYFGFKVLGNVGVKFKKNPDLNKVLSEKITLNEQTKTLGEWLSNLTFKTPLITRADYINIMISDKKDLTEKQLTDYLVYVATIKLGDEILKSATSDLGDLEGQEGIVIRRDDNSLYKITGSFVLRGLESAFGK
jgi:hypothetical protein